MNCQECREELVAYLESLLDESCKSEMDGHLTECKSCQVELQAVRELTVRLASDALAMPPVSMETAVMDRIVKEQALQLRRLKMRKRLRILGLSGAMVAAVALLFVSGFWLAQPALAEPEQAAKILAQGAEAVPNPATVHLVTKMRTPPGDNFGVIIPKCDPVTIEVWRQFGDKPKWRMEEPGRVMIMDGTETVCWIRHANFAWKTPRTGDKDCSPVLDLTKIHDMISRQLSTALAKGWDLKLAHETAADGQKKLVVTVETKAGLPANDYLKNKYLDTSDARRVYRFDAKTKRLEGFEAYLHEPDGDVLVLSIEKIEYDCPIDPKLFALELPENVRWIKEPERLADNEKYEKMTPKEAARVFFEACGKEDWGEVQKFVSWPVDDRLKSYLGGLKLVSLGEPFQSKGYAGGRGWFVPYEIGITMKMRVGVANDNPAKRYLVFTDLDHMPDAKALANVKKLPDNEKYEKMTPREAVQAFFDGWARKDIDAVKAFMDDEAAAKLEAKDLEDGHFANVVVGEPSEAKTAGRWEVPIEVRFTHKHNLALRNDNAAKRYVVDGGI